MNGFQYAVAAWLPIVIFPQTMAPTFRYGFPGTFGLVIAALVAIVVIQLLQNRSWKKEKGQEEPVSEQGDEELSVDGEYVVDLKNINRISNAKEVNGLT
jgi:ACS family pantothenate transporter-like MFS transporter